jgi:hypothetical protein
LPITNVDQKGCFVKARVGARGGVSKCQQQAWEEGVDVVATNEIEVRFILPQTGATLVKKLKSIQLRFV